MVARFISHVSRNAYGIVAIFIALGGSAYAAAKIGSNDIKPNAVKSKHIKDGKVKAADVDPALFEGIDAATLDGAILVSDQDSDTAGSAATSIGEIPGVGHFEAQCNPGTVQARFVSESGVGDLAVIQHFGTANTDALYEEVPNGGATSFIGTSLADANAAMITYRIHRGQQAAPEVRTPKATITVTLRRGTPTIPDLCNYTVQGIAEP